MSLFARLLRYQPSEHLTQTENFCTEVFAAFFRAYPSVFWEWIEAPSVGEAGESPESGTPGETRVLTQMPCIGSGFVDLVLERYCNDQRQLAYVECKVEAGVSGSQLNTYARALAQEEAGWKALVYATLYANETERGEREWVKKRWHTLYPLVSRHSDEPLAAEVAALMRHLRMDDSQHLDLDDLFVLSRTAPALKKLDSVLQDLRVNSALKNLVQTKRWGATDSWPLMKHQRWILSSLTNDRLWDGERSAGLMLVVGFELGGETEQPCASCFLEVPQEWTKNRREDAWSSFDAFVHRHQDEDVWTIKHPNELHRKLYASVPLVRWLGAKSGVQEAQKFLLQRLADLGPA